MGIILVLDIGTSSMRGVLYTELGKVVNTCQILYSPEFLPDHRVEQEPACWEDALIRITAQAVQWSAARGLPIDAVSVTSQRSSAIPVDRDGVPLRKAIMWQDRRTYDLCRELEPYAEEVYSRTGSRINPVFTAPKLAWLKRHEPAVYDKAYKILVIPDYVLFLMTGQFMTDYTYGSRTSLMNISTLEWDDELLALFQIHRDKLCELVPQGSITAYTSEAFRQKTGLRSGTPVVSAGGDQQCGALGSGVIDNGSIQITSGTGSFLLASSNRLVLDREMRTICNVSAVKGKYVLESSILTASTVCNWFARSFYPQEDEHTSLEKMLEEACQSAPGSNGVLTLPHFQGRGSPDWNPLAKGLFFNIDLGTTRGDLARSVLEGIVLEIAENLDIMGDQTGGIHSVIIAGGLTKSPLYNQIQADVYNRMVTLPANRETTSLGAWISAALALELYPSLHQALKSAANETEPTYYQPDAQHAAVYEKLKSGRMALYHSLKDSRIYHIYGR